MLHGGPLANFAMKDLKQTDVYSELGPYLRDDLRSSKRSDLIKNKLFFINLSRFQSFHKVSLARFKESDSKFFQQVEKHLSGASKSFPSFLFTNFANSKIRQSSVQRVSEPFRTVWQALSQELSVLRALKSN